MRPLLPLLALVLLPAPAMAAELFAGVYAHSVNTPFTLESNREKGTDLSAGVRGGSIGRLLGKELQPYAFATVNTSGGTNFLAAGLSTKFGDKVYFRPGLGIAVHDGSAANFTQPDKLAFGSRVLFEPEVAVGTRLNERLSLEASWVHFSHAQILGKQNPGIDIIGARLNYRL